MAIAADEGMHLSGSKGDIKDEWLRVGGLVLLSTLLVTLAYSLRVSIR